MFRFPFSKKKLLIIGIVLIIVGLSILSYNKFLEYCDIKKQTNIINRDFYSGTTNEYNDLKYIIIPELNIKRIIMDDSTDEILDRYYVGLVSGNIDDSLGNIVLAGHNVKQVFHGLHQIKLGTEIILKSKQKETFIVDNKYETLKNDYNVLKTTTDIKKLTLITCTHDPDYRLIVTAKKVE